MAEQKNGAVVKLFWARDGKEYVETINGVSPGALHRLQKSQGMVTEKGILVYVRVEIPEVS